MAVVSGPVDNVLREPLAAVLDRVSADWRPLIEAWRASAAGRTLVEAVAARQAAGALIYPAGVLRALEWTPLKQVRVVVLGQDPYHGPGQAEGLAFSVPAGNRAPPSLRNILAELGRDLDVPMDQGQVHLGPWARQGVLLLNTCLTVEQGRPAAHAKLGWEALTDRIVGAVAEAADPKVFMLWGGHAQAKAALVEAAGAGRHLILKANHPSPLSARRPPLPFLGCGHFGQAQRFMQTQRPGEPALSWEL